VEGLEKQITSLKKTNKQLENEMKAKVGSGGGGSSSRRRTYLPTTTTTTTTTTTAAAITDIPLVCFCFCCHDDDMLMGCVCVLSDPHPLGGAFESFFGGGGASQVITTEGEVE